MHYAVLMLRCGIRQMLLLASTFLAQNVLALSPSQVFDKVKDSVVVVRTFDADGKNIALGSGVVLPSRKIATNCHILKNGVRFQIGGGEKFTPATRGGGDEEKDICFLEATGFQVKPAELGQTNRLRVGDRVYAVGTPRGLELSLSEGIVSQLRGDPPPLIQTTAAISPGSSGGGLFDTEGRLVGFTTLFILEGQNLNFALPVEWAGENQPTSASIQQRSSEDWMKPISTFKAAKDWKGLATWSFEWVQAQPENSQAWTQLGTALVELKQYNESVTVLQRAIRTDPDNGYAWARLGDTFAKLERLGDAMDAYRQVVRINPKDQDAWDQLAWAYRQLGRYNEAVEAHHRSIQINSHEAEYWHSLAVTHKKFNRYSDAIEAYKQAVRIKPQAYIWEHIAEAYEKINRYSDAIEAYKQAVRIETSEKSKGLRWLSIGDAYKKLGRYTEALPAYQQANRIFPNSGEIWSRIASTHKSIGNQRAALEALTKLQRIDPDLAATTSKALGITLPTASSGKVDGRWTEVEVDSVRTTYAELATRRNTDDLIKMWYLMTFNKAKMLDNPIKKAYLSSMAQDEFDCKERRSRGHYVSFHAGKMGDGEVIFHSSDLGRWEPIPPGSVGEILWQTACPTK